MALSQRGSENIKLLMPHVPPSLLVDNKQAHDPDASINLSMAENTLLRAEISTFYQEIQQTDSFAEHLSIPKGFAGDPDLLAALAGFFNLHFHPHVAIQPSHITTAPGGAGSLDALLYNICDPGDCVLVPAPFWPGYNVFLYARSSITLIPVWTSSLPSLTGPELLPALESGYRSAPPRVKALVLSNPHNPLGRCYGRPTLESCLRFCQQHALHLVSDEVFALSTFASPDLTEPEPFVSVLALDAAHLGCDASRLHVVYSLSKDFGLSGLRLGCTVSQANPTLRNGVALAASGQVANPSSLVVTRLLTSPRLPELVALNSARLADAYGLLTCSLKRMQIPYVVCGAALFLFARIAPNAQSWEDESLAVRQLAEAGVVVSAGRGFRVPEHEKGWARILFSVERRRLEMAIARIESVLGKG